MNWSIEDSVIMSKIITKIDYFKADLAKIIKKIKKVEGIWREKKNISNE